MRASQRTPAAISAATPKAASWWVRFPNVTAQKAALAWPLGKLVVVGVRRLWGRSPPMVGRPRLNSHKSSTQQFLGNVNDIIQAFTNFHSIDPGFFHGSFSPATGMYLRFYNGKVAAIKCFDLAIRFFCFVYGTAGKSFLHELLFPVAQGSDIDMRGIAEGVWMTGMTYLQVRHASIRKNPPYLLKYRPRIRQVLKQIEGRNQITSGRVERKASLNIRHDQSTADFILTL